MSRFSVDLKAFFFSDTTPERVRLEEVLRLGDERIFGFLLAVFAFPNALPIPHFGLSIPFGLVLAFFSVQLLLGKHRPWLPPRLNNVLVKRDRIRKFLNLGLPWIERLEAIAKPRYSTICTTVLGRLLIGSVSLIASSVMLIPIPGTNILPAIGLFVTGIGLLEDDGLVCLVGLGISLLSAGVGGLILATVLLGGFSFFDSLPMWGAI
jgi:hypothetical protein